MSKNLKLLVSQPGKIGDLVVTTSFFNTIFENFGQFDLIAGGFAEDFFKCDQRIGKLFNRSVSWQELKKENYTHALLLVPSAELVLKFKLANIKNIYGSTHGKMNKYDRLASLFLNKKFPYNFVSSAEEYYLNFARALGAKKFVSERTLNLCSEEQTIVKDLLQKLNLLDKKLAGISVSAGKSFKEWGIQNFANIANWLIERDFFIVGVGAKEDRNQLESFKRLVERPEKVVLITDFYLQQIAYLMKELKIFISADTGPIYIADAMGTPVVDIMGPCSSNSQRPIGPNAKLVGECFNPIHPKSFIMHSPNYKHDDYLRCMKEVKVESVKEALNNLPVE